MQKVNSTGVTFKGKGANESLRVYLYPADNNGKWTATLYNDVEGGEVKNSELGTERMLYFRLKSSQHLVIKCSTVGRMKVLE